LVIDPKSDRGRPTVPLPPSLVPILRAHRAAQHERRLFLGRAWVEDYVFDRGDGQPMDPDSFGKAFRDARDALGLVGMRPHDLRHAFATMLVQSGANIRVISDVLGHSKISFTMQTYVHPDEEQIADVAARTQAALGDALDG
jgi:integrase